MKRLLSTILCIFTATIFSGVALAQGRHDEKPHGVIKPAPSAVESSRRPATGGRHDEGGTTHGKKNTAAKKAPAGDNTPKPE